MNVVMPKLSDTMEEGKILRWLKKPGDRVAVGDVLAEVETDKADMELEAEASGVLGKILIEDSDLEAVKLETTALPRQGKARRARARPLPLHRRATPARQSRSREALDRSFHRPRRRRVLWGPARPPHVPKVQSRAPRRFAPHHRRRRPEAPAKSSRRSVARSRGAWPKASERCRTST